MWVICVWARSRVVNLQLHHRRLAVAVVDALVVRRSHALARGVVVHHKEIRQARHKAYRTRHIVVVRDVHARVDDEQVRVAPWRRGT